MTTSSSAAPKPVILCILDGWGDAANATPLERDNNAILQAATPTWDRMVESYPKAQLNTSGAAVGLPDGQMGNSEVGHMNLGAGRVVRQDLPRIDHDIETGALGENEALQQHIAALQASGGTCHLLGLVSPGGVHSHQDHMIELARIVSSAGVPVRLHGFLDGRDTAPGTAPQFVAEVQAGLEGLTDAKIATLTGRYYAMDRDTNWDRVSKAYDALVLGEGAKGADLQALMNTSLEADVTDEFMLPMVTDEYTGMADGDGILMANFRADRARHILDALGTPGFNGFERAHVISFAAKAGMVGYSTELDRHFDVLFPPLELTEILGEVVSKAGLKQLRIAETEKYAHVTFFFNGGQEEVFDGEERILIPSPKVATYDLQPEMSAPEVTEKMVAAIETQAFDLIIANFANGDMVGHTGSLAAAVKAAETIDGALAKLEVAVTKVGGAMIVTADHGNCEQMADLQTGAAHTAHTLNPVPAILIAEDKSLRLSDGRLADVAPTLLDLLAVEQPAVMTGRSLLSPSGAQVAAE